MIKFLLVIIVVLGGMGAYRIYNRFFAEKPKSEMRIKAEEKADVKPEKTKVQDYAPSYVAEVFRGYSDARRDFHCGMPTLETDRGTYIQGEASLHGMVEKLHCPTLSKSYAVARCRAGTKLTFVVAQKESATEHRKAVDVASIQ